MKRIAGTFALAVIVLAGCGSSGGKPSAAPTSVRTVTVPASAAATGGLDAAARLACSKTDSAITAYGDGSDVSKSADAIAGYALALSGASLSKTTLIANLAKTQIGSSSALEAIESAGPEAFATDTQAMRDACIQSGWTSTSS